MFAHPLSLWAPCNGDSDRNDSCMCMLDWRDNNFHFLSKVKCRYHSKFYSSIIYSVWWRAKIFQTASPTKKLENHCSKLTWQYSITDFIFSKPGSETLLDLLQCLLWDKITAYSFPASKVNNLKASWNCAGFSKVQCTVNQHNYHCILMCTWSIF